MPPPFIEALETLESEISSELFHGYGSLVIPHELDHKIEQFIESYLAATQANASYSTAFQEKRAMCCLPSRNAKPHMQFVRTRKNHLCDRLSL
jgi:hypothetical protein